MPNFQPVIRSLNEKNKVMAYLIKGNGLNSNGFTPKKEI
jgi:hypothetical protein